MKNEKVINWDEIPKRSIDYAPWDEYVMAFSKDFFHPFGPPYEYRKSDMQWIDPSPEYFITMGEYNKITKP